MQYHNNVTKQIHNNMTYLYEVAKIWIHTISNCMKDAFKAAQK